VQPLLYFPRHLSGLQGEQRESHLRRRIRLCHALLEVRDEEFVPRDGHGGGASLCPRQSQDRSSFWFWAWGVYRGAPVSEGQKGGRAESSSQGLLDAGDVRRGHRVGAQEGDEDRACLLAPYRRCLCEAPSRVDRGVVEPAQYALRVRRVPGARRSNPVGKPTQYELDARNFFLRSIEQEGQVAGLEGENSVKLAPGASRHDEVL
jgi:hypothetical protein